MQNIFFGTVVHGLGKGKEFGFPTCNIRLNNNDLCIENGVYAVKINICRDAMVGCCRDAMHCVSTTYYGMLYVGTRPTLNRQETSIEIHIFDFNEDVYNQRISFQILHKIRDEIRFESTAKLIEQLHQDKEMVYRFFN